jgi:mRNA-degrading endonuclease RelE of RelBE toxin-antitoxin system
MDAPAKTKKRTKRRKRGRPWQREEAIARSRARVSQITLADPSSALSITEKLPAMQVMELYGVWKNCLRKLDDSLNSDWHQSARIILDAVEAEWESRAKGFVDDGDYFKWPTTEALEFRIADTFTDSLTKLTAQEQKAVKTTAFDLQMNASAPGLSFHKLDRAKDSNFWSVRVNADIRLIVHRTTSSILLAYVDHHDDAYRWAERRKIERHPTTGAMQLVEVRERVEEVEVFRPPQEAAPVDVEDTDGPKLFDNLRKVELMSFGVPEEWVDDVRGGDRADLVRHHRAPAAGGPGGAPETRRRRTPRAAAACARRSRSLRASGRAAPLPRAHERRGARTRARVPVGEMGGLSPPRPGPVRGALLFRPGAHLGLRRDRQDGRRAASGRSPGPDQRRRPRPAHHVFEGARERPQGEAAAPRRKRARDHAADHRAVDHQRRLRPVCSLFGQPNIASPALVRSLLAQAAEKVEGHTFSPQFLFGEWTEVVDAWQITTWEDYANVSRLGRKTRIGGRQREVLWSIFEHLRASLSERNAVTWPDVFGRLAEHLSSTEERPFDFAVVDEAQDIGVAEARFLAALVPDRADGLFFAGDLGQRIFQQPFSWKSLGIDVRGRSHTLRINYRTSHQIRAQSDRLLPPALSDVDGNAESRRGTISVFNGPPPEIHVFDSSFEEGEAVGRWVADRLNDGYQPHEIGVFVRASDQLKRVRAALKTAGAPTVELSDRIEAEVGKIAVSTMHLAKGLEFRAVVVMACDDEVIPSQERIETVTDESDLEEVYNTERHLLYVACTRARDRLMISGVEPASEFLEDLAR